MVAKDATAAEKHVAKELQDHLKQVTGEETAIGHALMADRPNLLVGPGAAKLAVSDFSVEEWGTDGLLLRSEGRNLVLAGGRPRGTLYAVYTFLEESVGVRPADAIATVR